MSCETHILERKLANNQSACTWLGCGASNPYISNRGAFIAYRDIELVAVEVCNGSAHIIWKGNVEIKLSGHTIILFSKDTTVFKKKLVYASLPLENNSLHFGDTPSFTGC